MRRHLSVALLVPEPFATEINGLRRALRDRALDRYVPHITLAPPVNVNETRLEETLALVRSVAATHQPVKLEIGPAATFLPRNPVTYLSVDGALSGLNEELAVEPLRVETSYPFVPHVTIGQNDADITSLIGYETEVDIDRLFVMERDENRIWFPIADTPFGEPAIAGRGGVELEMITSQLADPTTVRLIGRPPTQLVVTGRHGGNTAGVAYATFDGSHADLGAVVVDREMRGQGFGAHLLKQFIYECRVRAVKSISTGCTKADSLFEGHGFERDDSGDLPLMRLKL